MCVCVAKNRMVSNADTYTQIGLDNLQESQKGLPLLVG